MNLKILIVGVEPLSIVNFRGRLIKDLVSEGYEVVALANGGSLDQISKITALGCRYVSYSSARTGINPIRDLWTLAQLLKHILVEKPTHVLAYTIKPVIWGGIACRFFPRVRFIGMITGLGYAFYERRGLSRFIKICATFLYRIGLSRASAVIFQNDDNKLEFQKLKITRDSSKVHVTRGSGVDLNHFTFKQGNSDKLTFTFLLIARMLRDKGIAEFIEASILVSQQHPEISFVLAGPEDDSPNSLNIRELLTGVGSEKISYLGPLSDVRPAIEHADVFVLPSYHEGMPRTVLEAMSIGKPIITTNVCGCKETVEEGLNGWLIPHQNSAILAEKMFWFIENKSRINEMGLHSRGLAVKYFDVNKVNQSILQILNAS
tara:strand:- start:2950 stop:4077 length:1128 start_codon:yes stop_codon:yes gene_type:complete